MPTVGDTRVSLGGQAQLIQNLGPDKLYLGGPDVTEDDGLEVLSGQTVSIGPLNDELYAVSDDTCDVRTLVRGAGLFTTPS